MSILIKGMDMPKKGEYHMTLYVDSDSAYIDVESFPEDKDKFEVIQVPPHGRLIDADVLESTLNKMGIWGDARVKGFIKSIPTVIPADEDGET